MDLQNAINHARLAKAINSEDRDIPANAALVVLLAEVERLKEERDEARRLSRCLHLVVPESKRENYCRAFPWLEGE